MKVLLKKSQGSLGHKGEIVDVKSGFARNFLIPQEIAEPAHQGAIAHAKLLKAKEAKAKQVLKDKVKDIRKQLEDKTIKIKAKAGKNGTLFGAVSAAQIATAISQEIGLKLPQEIVKLDKDIKEVNDYNIELLLDKDNSVKVLVKILPEE